MAVGSEDNLEEDSTNSLTWRCCDHSVWGETQQPGLVQEADLQTPAQTIIDKVLPFQEGLVILLLQT